MSWRRKIDRLLARRDFVSKRLKKARKESIAAENTLTNTLEAQSTLQTLAKEVQQTTHKQIAGLVTRCLQSVFNDQDLEFKIEFEERRGKTEAHLILVQDGNEMRDPLNELGGGVVDVAAFALRLVCLILSRPTKRRLLVLDEPFRFVSVEYRPAVARLLTALAEELDVQILIVTHLREFELGTVIDLG